MGHLSGRVAALQANQVIDMTVTSVGSGPGSAVAVLERQLLADQRTLADDQKAKAAAAVLAADQARVQTDAAAITSASGAGGFRRSSPARTNLYL
jgi:hypothetical protein